jgi:hypothetical protein
MERIMVPRLHTQHKLTSGEQVTTGRQTLWSSIASIDMDAIAPSFSMF